VKSMVDRAAIMVANLLIFMDCFMLNDVIPTGQEKNEAWHLVYNVMKHFCSDVYAVRGRAKFLLIQGEKADSITSATYLWVSLQAHHIIEAYIDVNFWHHPSIVPVITIHLYSHQVPDSMYQAVGSMCHTIERTDRQGYPNC
jgi:hypothetical protein